MEVGTILEMGNIPVQDTGAETVTNYKRVMVIQFPDVGSFQRAIADGRIELTYPDGGGHASNE